MSDLDVLFVGDDGDAASIERAFEASDLPGRLHAIGTGEEAIEWLRRGEGYENAPRPDLLLLELNQSSESATSALETIKSDARYRRLPVLVLASSPSESELGVAYDNYANACLRKPDDRDGLVALLEGVADFWAATAELPIAYDDEEAMS